jgi:hypothetical protein
MSRPALEVADIFRDHGAARRIIGTYSCRMYVTSGMITISIGNTTVIARGMGEPAAAIEPGDGALGQGPMDQQFGPLLYTISVWALPAIIAITFHEAAHGFVALRFGDDTA